MSLTGDDTSIFGDGLIKCQNCCSTEYVIRYHQYTRYVDCDRNWVNLCPECKELNDEQWKDMWEDLRMDILYNSARTIW